MAALSMAKVHVTASTLRNNSSDFRHPVVSGHLSPKLVTIALPRFDLPSLSLRILKKAWLPRIKYECRSQLLAAPLTNPADTHKQVRIDISEETGYTKRAFISVSDKSDLVFLGNALRDLGYTIVSTRGTATSLEEAGIPVTKVEDITGFPDILDGRVKTFASHIFAGLFANRDQKHHMKTLAEYGIGTFDVVVVNFYPFYDDVSSPDGVALEEVLELVDIGGPSLCRSAAKNHEKVLVAIDPDDYRPLLSYLKGKQEDRSFRRMLAWEALQYATAYDSHVCKWWWNNTAEDKSPSDSTLRYGENSQQNQYLDSSLSVVDGGGIAKAIKLQGKEMSINNYLDANVAWDCVCDFVEPTCVVVNHENPCGVASRGEAYKLAVGADPLSAYGGIVAFNVEVDEALAQQIREFRCPLNGLKMSYEVVVAPGYTQKALEILRRKSKDLRVMKAKKNKRGKLSLREIIGGGMLVQDPDELTLDDIKFQTVSDKCPSEKELDDINLHRFVSSISRAMP